MDISRRILSFFQFIFNTVLIIAGVFAFIWGITWLFCLDTFSSGDPVTILTNRTSVRGNSVCQEVEYGNIAYTGDRNLQNYRVTNTAWVFPQAQYRVIYPDGSAEWIKYKYIHDYAAASTFCSPVVNSD